jgi:hypothetical protein
MAGRGSIPPRTRVLVAPTRVPRLCRWFGYQEYLLCLFCSDCTRSHCQRDLVQTSRAVGSSAKTRCVPTAIRTLHQAYQTLRSTLITVCELHAYFTSRRVAKLRGHIQCPRVLTAPGVATLSVRDAPCHPFFILMSCLFCMQMGIKLTIWARGYPKSILLCTVASRGSVYLCPSNTLKH